MINARIYLLQNLDEDNDSSNQGDGDGNVPLSADDPPRDDDDEGADDSAHVEESPSPAGTNKEGGGARTQSPCNLSRPVSASRLSRAKSGLTFTSTMSTMQKSKASNPHLMYAQFVNLMETITDFEAQGDAEVDLLHHPVSDPRLPYSPTTTVQRREKAQVNDNK